MNNSEEGKSPNSIGLWDYDIFSGSLSEIKLESKDKFVINTINAYSYVVAKKDELFKQALMSSNILLPDGFPIVFAAKYRKQAKIVKIAGEDIFLHLLSELNAIQGKAFFLGASQDTLIKISQKSETEYPNVVVGSYSPPFTESFLREDSLQMLSAINNFKPDVLFIGMTAPKQEKWVHEHLESLNSKIVCSVGAVFDFYAGTIKRPSKFWISMKLEWFVRLLMEPNRLWKRYLYYSPQFFKDVLLKKT